MAGWIKVREHIWTDEHGTSILRHTKYLKPNGEVAFPWETRIAFGETGIARWFKDIDPSITGPLLYGLPEFATASRREYAWLAEGERDVDSLREHGVLAVTNGGALGFSVDHAELFRGWRGRVTIVRDLDDAGAVDAARKYDRLRAVGIAATRLRVVRGRVNRHRADAHDHLSAGYTIDQFVREPIAKVRKLAATATPESIARSGSASGVNPHTGYVLVSADEVAQLAGWRPNKQEGDA